MVLIVSSAVTRGFSFAKMLKIGSSVTDAGCYGLWTVLLFRVRGLLTDAMLTRLRRESRDARKNRYSAPLGTLSTKSIIKLVISIIFFQSHAKKSRRNDSYASETALWTIKNRVSELQRINDSPT